MLNTPRIVVAVSLPPPVHGVTHANALLVDVLRQARFSVYHLDTGDQRDLRNIGRFDFLNALAALKVGLVSLRLLSVNRPSVLYIPISQNALGFLRDALVLLAARLSGARRVVHLHGGAFHLFYARSPLLMRWLVRQSLQGVTSAVVLDECLRICFRGIVPDNVVRVIPNGVERFDCPRLARPLDSLTVLWLSGLSEAKGVFDLLNAIPAVVAEYPETRFVFAGEWYSSGERLSATRLVRESSIEDHVSWLGPVYGQAKTDLLCAADVFVLPSKQIEGQPFAILEAMSAGLPTVATRSGAIVDMIDDGVSGLLVSEGQPAELAAAISSLLGNPTMRATFGEAARRVVERRFTVARWRRAMLGLLVDAGQ